MPPPPPSAINPPPPPAPSGLPTPSKTAVAAAFTMSASDLNKGLKKVSDEERAKNVTKEPTALASLRNLKGFELAQQKANSRVSHRYSVVVVNEIDEWNKDENLNKSLRMWKQLIFIG